MNWRAWELETNLLIEKLAFRVTIDLKTTLQTLAKADNRNLSEYIRIIIEEAIEQKIALGGKIIWYTNLLGEEKLIPIIDFHLSIALYRKLEELANADNRKITHFCRLLLAEAVMNKLALLSL